MIIKRYIVDSMNEAMVRIRYELGKDAVIISQRKIRQKGFKGLFKGKKIEVTAAVDDKGKKDEVLEKDKIQQELMDIKDIVSKLTSDETVNEKSKSTKTGITKKLSDNDISYEIIDDIYNKIKKEKNLRTNSKQFEKEVREEIENRIRTNGKLNGKIHAFIGPTGVGKTTTIAKLASYYTLYQNKKVGLITIDTYRIGAVEQLKIYAGILSAPFGVVISPNDLNKVMDTMADCDLIFVDTTGRSSKNPMQISETKRFINELKPDEVHLVLSMTTKQKDIRTIVENYKIIEYNSLILTKLDETDIHGSILTALYYGDVPISFITNGQGVPEDIIAAEKDYILEKIMGAES